MNLRKIFEYFLNTQIHILIILSNFMHFKTIDRYLKTLLYRILFKLIYYETEYTHAYMSYYNITSYYSKETTKKLK